MKNIQALGREVVRWQKTHGRHDLPWMVPEAYLRWLSEIMLQQTQVSVVRGYFARFVERFPTVVDLAHAPQDEVMRLWAGLGYYSRARNLHAAAQKVLEDFEGKFPQSVEELTTLPGVGRSTAAAIASFCFNIAEPVLDGNVKRVLSRLLAYEESVDGTAGEKELLTYAKSMIQGNEPGVFNQGMMDLGATVCTKSTPKCGACPLAQSCRAFADGSQSLYPKRKLKIKRVDRTLCLGVVLGEEGVLMVRRPAGDIWAGLWCFPEIEKPNGATPFARVKRTLTHINLTLELFYLRSQDAPQDLWGGFWVAKKDWETAPVPSPVKALLTSLQAEDDLQLS